MDRIPANKNSRGQREGAWSDGAGGAGGCCVAGIVAFNWEIIFKLKQNILLNS